MVKGGAFNKNQWGNGKGGGKGEMAQMLMQMMMSKGGFGGKGKSKGGKGGGGGKREPDPPNSGRVFVRGFDFGTTDEQFEGHMGTAGEIVKVRWVTKGSAEVVFKTKAAAQKAANTLNGSIIDGNTRYMDVLLKESE